MEKKEQESIKEMVLKEWDKGNVVYADFDGLKSIKFEDFINQPLDGMLYDINRDSAIILTYIDNPKWVNDFALIKLLEYYYNKCKEQEKILNTSCN